MRFHVITWTTHHRPEPHTMLKGFLENADPGWISSGLCEPLVTAVIQWAREEGLGDAVFSGEGAVVDNGYEERFFAEFTDLAKAALFRIMFPECYIVSDSEE